MDHELNKLVQAYNSTSSNVSQKLLQICAIRARTKELLVGCRSKVRESRAAKLPQTLWLEIMSFAAKADITALLHVSHRIYFHVKANPESRFIFQFRAFQDMAQALDMAKNVPIPFFPLPPTDNGGTARPRNLSEKLITAAFGGDLSTNVAILTQSLESVDSLGYLRTSGLPGWSYIEKVSIENVSVQDLLMYADRTLLYYSHKLKRLHSIDHKGVLTHLPHLESVTRTDFFTEEDVPRTIKLLPGPKKSGVFLRVLNVNPEIDGEEDLNVTEIQDVESGSRLWTSVSEPESISRHTGHRFLSNDTFLYYQRDDDEGVCELRLVDVRVDVRESVVSEWDVGFYTVSADVAPCQLSDHNWLSYNRVVPNDDFEIRADWRLIDLRSTVARKVLPPWYCAGTSSYAEVEAIHIQKINGWIHYFMNVREREQFRFNVMDYADVWDNGGRNVDNMDENCESLRSNFVCEAITIDAKALKMYQNELLVLSLPTGFRYTLLK